MTERKRPDVIECPSSVESTRFGTDGGTRPARCPMSVSEGGCPNPLVGDVVQILLTFFPRRPYGIDSGAGRSCDAIAPILPGSMAIYENGRRITRRRPRDIGI